jgi:hypothetical protein
MAELGRVAIDSGEGSSILLELASVVLKDSWSMFSSIELATVSICKSCEEITYLSEFMVLSGRLGNESDMKV